MNKKILFLLTAALALALAAPVLCYSSEGSDPNIQRDYFTEVLMGPYTADVTMFGLLNEFVDLANKHKIKLTLLFSPAWAQMILDDPAKLLRVGLWQSEGHEIGGYHHGPDTLPWDGYSDLMNENIERLRNKRPITLPIEEQMAKAERYAGSLYEFVDLIKKIAGGKIKVITSTTQDLEWPQNIPYAVGGRRVTEAVSAPRRVELAGKDVVRITAAALRWQTESPRQTFKDLEREFFSSKPGIFGVVFHDVDYAKNPKLYQAWFKFLNFVDPAASHSKTISRAIEDYLTQTTTSRDMIESSPFGFHASAIAAPFQYDLLRPFDAAVDIGVRWERPPLYFFQTMIQSDPVTERYDWSKYDRLVKLLPDSMRIVANITIGDPRRDGYYTRYAVDKNTFMPLNREAYKRFVRAVVDRYDGDGSNDMPGLKNPLHYWQADNEPPHGLKDYALLLKVTYEAIKEQDPQAKVLIGGVPGMPPVENYIEEFEKNFMPILRELSESGQPFFDIFDVHWYGDASGDYLGIKDVLKHIKNRLSELGLEPADGYWITEMGTYSGDPKPLPFINYPYQTERQQAADLVKRYVVPLSLGIKKIFMAFGLKEGFKNSGSYFDFTGLIYDGFLDNDQGRGVKKLGYYAYKKMTEILEGSDWSTMESLKESDGIYLFRCRKNNKKIWIAWTDRPQGATLAIPNIASERVAVTDAVPRFEYGKAVKNYTTAFPQKTKQVREGKVVINLTDSPVYVQEL